MRRVIDGSLVLYSKLPTASLHNVGHKYIGENRIEKKNACGFLMGNKRSTC